MRKMMNRLNKREGFTLAELLIVVAIIAVLVAIAIPVFNSQLEKSRESTDAANIRAAYAEIAAAALTDPDTAATATVNKVQKQEGWQNTGIKDVAGVAITSINSNTDSTVTYTPASSGAGGEIKIDGTAVKGTFIGTNSNSNTGG